MKQIITIQDIDLELVEGKLLISAIAIISSRYETSMTPDEILKEIKKRTPIGKQVVLPATDIGIYNKNANL